MKKKKASETISGMADTITLKQLTFKFKINAVRLILKRRSRFFNKEAVSVCVLFTVPLQLLFNLFFWNNAQIPPFRKRFASCWKIFLVTASRGQTRWSEQAVPELCGFRTEGKRLPGWRRAALADGGVYSEVNKERKAVFFKQQSAAKSYIRLVIFLELIEGLNYSGLNTEMGFFILVVNLKCANGRFLHSWPFFFLN